MTDPIERETIEREIRDLCEAGDQDRAATLLLKTYGRELFRFLLSRLRDEQLTGEAFSEFTEDLWKGLASFRWQCSARVWSYTLARHAASRHIAVARRRRARESPLSRAGPLSEIAQKVRTQTLAAMRTEMKSRVAELREKLPLDDQTLIILRISRKLDWKEIAQVMLDEKGEPTDRALDKEAARLRQRFQAIKEKLRKMAAEAGIGGREGEEA
jgi:RNA polymerase sigma-70 factor (ECF subfamily)